MTPLIKSGQEHVLSPINLSDVEVGDIVFCKVKGTPVELPVYHVRDARDYIRWWLDGKQGL